jgi:hypothetical protein
MTSDTVRDGADSAFEDVVRRAERWIHCDSATHATAFRENEKWFDPAELHESSVFLYVHLAESTAVAERAQHVARVCRDAIGSSNFVAAPTDGLHSTVLTDSLSTVRAMTDNALSECYVRYIAPCRYLGPFTMSVLGPYMTAGAVIIRCSADGNELSKIREWARSSGGRPGREPRIPSINYLTVGYLVGGDERELRTLFASLAEMRDGLEAIPVVINRIVAAKTINKAILPPALSFDLTSAASSAAPSPEEPPGEQRHARDGEVADESGTPFRRTPLDGN